MNTNTMNTLKNWEGELDNEPLAMNDDEIPAKDSQDVLKLSKCMCAKEARYNMMHMDIMATVVVGEAMACAYQPDTEICKKCNVRH